MYVKISYVQSSFMTALSARDGQAFYAAVRTFSLICAGAAPLFAVSDYVQARGNGLWFWSLGLSGRVAA